MYYRKQRKPRIIYYTWFPQFPIVLINDLIRLKARAVNAHRSN